MRLILLLLSFSTFLSFAQPDTVRVIEPIQSEEPIDSLEEDGEIMTIGGCDPEFPGGERAMMEFFMKNVEYPDTAMVMGIQGIVYVQFVIDKTGEVADVKTIRGVHWSLDQEAERVVKSMPRWTPCMQNGKAYRVRFTYPIRFRLG